MGQEIRLPWGVSRVGSFTLDLLEDEERRCLDVSALQVSVLRQMVYPWVKMPKRLVEDHGDYQITVDMPVAYVEALEELEILLSGAYDGPIGGCPVGTVYVYRGDPSAWDYTLANLIANSTWHDLDLVNIVTDADATMVHISTWFLDDQLGSVVQFKRNGQSNDLNVLQGRTQQTYRMQNLDGLVAMDAASRVVRYWIATGFDEVYLTVRGWWKPA